MRYVWVRQQPVKIKALLNKKTLVKNTHKLRLRLNGIRRVRLDEVMGQRGGIIDIDYK